jgi:hypothetical protein
MKQTEAFAMVREPLDRINAVVDLKQKAVNDAKAEVVEKDLELDNAKKQR